MRALFGALARRPGIDARAFARALVARAGRAHPGAAERTLVEDEGCALIALDRPGPPDALEPVSLGAGWSLFVAGNPERGGRTPADLFAPLGHEAVAATPAPENRWVAVAVHPARRAVRLLCDRLGTSWMYVAEHPDVFLFAPDYGALLAALPARPAVDRETAVVMLALAYAPDDRTAHEGVRLLPGGAVLELSEAGAGFPASLTPRYGDAHAGRSRAEKLGAIDALLDDSARIWLPGDDGDLALSLSGGNDSKYGAWMLHRAGRRAHAATFGHPRSDDARAARHVARRLGWSASAYYEGDRTDWEAWVRAIESIGTTGGFQWSGWTERWIAHLRAHGTRVLLGYFGDALSGRHLVPAAPAGGDWLDRWMTWSLDEGWADAAVLHPEAARTMRDASRERFRALVAGVEHAFPHQVALHLDWTSRQRRHTAAQPNLLDRRLEPLLFFDTAATLDFWANLPFEDLAGQSLYLAYARSRAPDLWPERRPPTLPERAWGFARNLAARALPSRRALFLPTEIDNAAIIAHNRATLAALVRREGDAVALVADPARVERSIAGFPGRSEMTSFQILRLTNWLLVLGAGRRDGGGREAA